MLSSLISDILHSVLSKNSTVALIPHLPGDKKGEIAFLLLSPRNPFSYRSFSIEIPLEKFVWSSSIE
jgi:hypothetical protein